MGFDHIALCMGAGRPTVIPMKNGLARGVRQASDFLMALQLTGAAKSESLANLQVRMPIVVIGGGLTAIDTATESLAYYVGAGREVPPPLRGADPGPRRGLRRGEAGSATRRRWPPSSSPTPGRSAPSAPRRPGRAGRPG